MADKKNTSREIVISGDRLFPLQFQFLGLAIFLGGVVATTQNILIGIILILMALLIFTGQGGVVLFPGIKKYKPYHSFLFIKFGKIKSYNEIEKIFINKGEYSQKIYTAHTMQHVTNKSAEYNAYLKFDDDNKIYLGYSKNKKKIIDRMERIATQLNIPLKDNTE